jgi:hypothetical protein
MILYPQDFPLDYIQGGFVKAGGLRFFFYNFCGFGKGGFANVFRALGVQFFRRLQFFEAPRQLLEHIGDLRRFYIRVFPNLLNLADKIKHSQAYLFVHHFAELDPVVSSVFVNASVGDLFGLTVFFRKTFHAPGVTIHGTAGEERFPGFGVDSIHDFRLGYGLVAQHLQEFGAQVVRQSVHRAFLSHPVPPGADRLPQPWRNPWRHRFRRG